GYRNKPSSCFDLLIFTERKTQTNKLRLFFSFWFGFASSGAVL
ncbi:hypothetical protein, partial [uncultured Gammaproteobacteria bacterium]